jgi:endoglucanase
MKRTVVKTLFACLASVALFSGCLHDGEVPKTAAASAGSSPLLASSLSRVSDKKCPNEFTLDDAEDNNNQIAVQKGRGGYWYSYADKVGTTLLPAAGAKFTMASGGANSSARAARLSGSVGTGGDVTFAGMGFGFTDPKHAYDASAFSGVSFWAKVDGDSATAVRLKVPDANTDPAGGVCTACFNDFGADIALTHAWTKFTVPFATMKQLDGWGAPHPAAIEPSKLFGLQWQVVTPGAKVDIWVDDVQFTGCP